MSEPALERLIWCDVETFGLDPVECPIVEIGFQVTDLNLRLIADFQTTIWNSTFDDKLAAVEFDNPLVYEMHCKSRLWEDAKESGRIPDEALAVTMNFLNSIDVTKEEPLCGSSVQFDRLMLAAQYPAVEALFSYRNIDVSTVKELCRRYNPRVYEGLAKTTHQLKLHRVLPDIDDTLVEFEFYRDNFLYI